MLRTRAKENIISPLLRTYLKRRANFYRPLFVLGLARSGTSMVAGVLGRCGAWLGNTVPGNSFNPKGYFENWSLRDGINKRMLEAVNADPEGIGPLPPLEELPEASDLNERVLRTLASQGYTARQPWLFKDAKLSLLWPLYKKAFPGARWIIVRRESESIVESCMKTPFMAKRSTDKAFWENWAREYMVRLELLKNAGVYWREVRVEELINGDFSDFKGIISEFGLQWRETEVQEFVQPSFWHS